ncbi:hypothetical protein BJV78DRAFT_1210421 [Lactifluus subvellereus]|nr:hypothetical protein BJV78DRAFT_1210421 [Lactifluus subvellereus]
MRGNVTTYALNNDSIASMVQGNLMPRPIETLSSVITITFICQERLSLSRIRSLFRVRRQVFLEALLWLRTHNSTYYGTVQIDGQRLAQIPEDDVPTEIVLISRHRLDEGLLDQKNSGYVSEPQLGATVFFNQFFS